MELSDVLGDEESFMDEVRACVSLFFNVEGEPSQFEANWMDLGVKDLKAIAEWLPVNALTRWQPSASLLKTLTPEELTKLRDDCELEVGLVDDDRDELERRILGAWSLDWAWCPDVFALPEVIPF